MLTTKSLRMDFIKFLFLIVLLKSTDGSSPSLPYPSGDIRNCPTEQIVNLGSPLLRMDALPGLGFDNLRNRELGQVYYRNYVSCQVSNDGYYLLPDNIYLIPVLNSEVDFFANVYDHYDDWKSTTSYSINADLKIRWANINGKFSAEYTDTKTKMVDSNARAVKIGLRHHLYSVHVNPDGQLHPSFKSRLMDLAAHIQNNNTEMAHYLSDLIVRDYGTHVVTSVEAGGALYQTSFISRDFMNNSETSTLKISASASFSFLSIFSLKINAHYTRTDTDINGFTNFTRHQRTSTHGGPPFKLSNFSYADWENGLKNNLIPIDKHGDPLFSAITTTNIPDLPDTLVLETADFVYQAIERYYKVNTHEGCTDFMSSNFDFRANVNDNSCQKNRQNYTFGGIYQICYNEELGYDVCGPYGSAQTNPLTSDYSCPAGYQSILLHTGTLSKLMPMMTYYRKCGFWSCHTYSRQVDVMRYARYSAYWCYYPPGKTVPPDSGYMFGGVYSGKHSNAVTGTSTCPPFYTTLHFGEDIKVCVSSDIEGMSYALPFGGFHSCNSGNPLSVSPAQYEKRSSFPLQCPQRYNQFLVTVDQGCIINYCSKVDFLLKYTAQPPILPPYKIRPPMTVNQSESLVIVGPYGTMWIKGDDGTWSKHKAGDKIDGDEYVMSFIADSQNITQSTTDAVTLNATEGIDDGSTVSPSYTGGQVAGIVLGSVFATALCIGFILVVGAGVNKYRKKRKTRKETLLYLDKSVPEPGENETAVLVQKIQD